LQSTGAKQLILSPISTKIAPMKHIISLFLIFGISFFGLAQEITVTPPKEKPKTATKTAVKKKPKVKPQTKIAAKAKTKPKAKAKAKAKITTVEAATKDGKPVTLKSNGTWEYSKTKPVTKETEKPVVKEVKKPVVKETQKPIVKEVKKPVVKEVKKPVVKETQKAVVKETQKPVVKEVKKPVVKETQKAVVKETQKPVVKEVKKPVVKSMPATCDLALKDSPTIRNLRLGMSRNDADRIIPSNRTNFPGSTIIAYPKSMDAGFENVESVMAEFFDGSLSGLTIGYKPGYKSWNNAKEFAQSLSDNLNLPSKYWKFDRKNADWSKMECRDFSITLDSYSNEMTLERVSSQQKTASQNNNRKEVFTP
jgi:hypothetical protein